jgi:ZIP family zinc transporter
MGESVSSFAEIYEKFAPTAVWLFISAQALAAFHAFAGLNHILQAFLAGLFTWGVTTLGATLVLFTRRVNQKLLDAMLGFSAGVMLAATYWSLLAPAIELAGTYGRLAWFPAAAGFALGALTLRLADLLLPPVHLGASTQGIATTWRRTILLV